jgi:membrane protein DedA with SNARE-associated domain/rhodanese-related sulfurtransferase
MEAVIEFVEAYGLWVAFVAVLLDQGGLPIPSYSVVIITAALAVKSNGSIPELLLVTVIAILIADVSWFYGGRRYGGRLLRLVCRLSLSPDSCVNLTRRTYARFGAPSLILAKYVPGFAAVATTLAGEAGTGLGRFLLFDGIGAALWAAGAIALGVIFNDAVAAVLGALEDLGHVATALLLSGFALYVILKWWKRRLFLQRIRMARISPDDLRDLLQSHSPPIVLDVRIPTSRARDGWIPGSIAAPLPHDPATDPSLEIIVYCDCPNDASAAVEARRLLDRGFMHVRPLAGGFGSWRERGLQVQRQ